MKMLVLGCGNMSSAIIEGLAKDFDYTNTYFFTPSQTRAQTLAAKVGGKFVGRIKELPADPEVVFIACKPQQFSELAKELVGKFTSNPTYISILAATPISLHESLLHTKKVLRVMPNMPVRFNKGISLLHSSADIPETEKLFWEEKFSIIGEAKWVQNEDEFNQLMLLTGSGPAFIYQWLKWMAEMNQGISKSEQEKLAISVMEGALAAIKSDDSKSLDTLISEVTSKGGVTAAVLEGWKNENVSTSLQRGWKKGLLRTAEIEKIILQSK